MSDNIREFDGRVEEQVKFNYDPSSEGAFHCDASENLLMESVNRGMYMIVKTGEVEGIVKFAGSMAFLCTDSVNPELMGKWLVPVIDEKSEVGPQQRVLHSIFINDASNISEIFTGITWRLSRDIRQGVISENIFSMIKDSPKDIYVERSAVEDYMDYVDWQEEATEEGYRKFELPNS